MSIVVLDACALIVLMRNEKGASLVQKQLYDPRVQIFIHGINFYEAYYDSLRHQLGLANLMFDFAKTNGIQIYDRMDKRLIEEGAIFKIHFKMSLADSIALGFAAKLNATLLTADRHEFGAVADAKIAKIKFIR